MTKKFLFMIFMMLPMLMMAQNGDSKKQTKFDKFVSKYGTIIKFEDKSLKPFETEFNTYLDAKIRVFWGEDKNEYYFILEKQRFGSSIAYIEYSDLVETNKAFARLLAEVKNDCELKPEYLESSFTSVDGFKIGYYVEKSKVTWYVKLEFRGDTFKVKQPENFANYLLNAQNEIETSMAQNGK